MRRSLLARGLRREPAGRSGPAGLGPGGHASTPRTCRQSVGINSIWVIVAALLVMLMQVGLRVPGDRLLAGQERRHGRREDPRRTSRSPRSATGRSASRSRSAAHRQDHRHARVLPARLRRPAPRRSRSWASSDATIEAKFFFQFVFCAVSLAIVWGTTLERIKFGVYVIYAVVFCALIYPIALGLGLRRRLAAGQHRHAGLRRLDGGPPHRRDRRAGRAAAPRPAARQVRPRRQAAGDPGPQHAAVRPRHPDPVARLVRLQPGLDAQRARRPLHRDRAASRTSRPPPACSARSLTARWKTKTIDIGMAGNGAIGALVAITAPVGLRRAVGRA